MNHRPKTPGVLNPSSDPLYEHLNDDSDTFGVNVYLAYWSAQTFRSPDTHIINKVCLKGFHIGIVEHVATIGIQATDEAGEPTGEDLTYTTFSTHLFKKDTPAEWQCIDIPEIELAGGVMYAIVVRVPTAGVGDRLVLRKTLDSGYPNGRAWESTNGGVTWGGERPMVLSVRGVGRATGTTTAPWSTGEVVCYYYAGYMSGRWLYLCRCHQQACSPLATHN